MCNGKQSIGAVIVSHKSNYFYWQLALAKNASAEYLIAEVCPYFLPELAFYVLQRHLVADV